MFMGFGGVALTRGLMGEAGGFGCISPKSSLLLLAFQGLQTLALISNLKKFFYVGQSQASCFRLPPGNTSCSYLVPGCIFTFNGQI